MRKNKDCRNCVKYDRCFLFAFGHDNFPASIPDYVNSMRDRDECFYNNKYRFEIKRRRGDQII